jgi:hypothetical protein
LSAATSASGSARFGLHHHPGAEGVVDGEMRVVAGQRVQPAPTPEHLVEQAPAPPPRSLVRAEPWL